MNEKVQVSIRVEFIVKNHALTIHFYFTLKFRYKQNFQVPIWYTHSMPNDIKPNDIKPNDSKPIDSKPNDINPNDIKPNDI